MSYTGKHSTSFVFDPPTQKTIMKYKVASYILREVGIDIKSKRKQVASNIAITHHPCSIHCILHVSAQV